MKKYFITIFIAALWLISISGYSEDIQLRHSLLDSFANQYTRPFTAIEIAACDGTYSLYLAKKYSEAVCVMIEGNELQGPAWGDLIFVNCVRQKLSNIILMADVPRSADLQRLSECEHFDLVFSFCAIERAEFDWKSLIDAMLKLGDHLLLEVMNTQVQAQNYLLQCGAHAMVTLSVSTIYYIACNKKTLKRKTWLRTLESKINIKSTFTEKKLIKKTPYHDNILTSNWKPGINLITFKMYHGVYPTTAMVKKALTSIEYVWHNDWAMHNIIVQGDSLSLIDYGDPRMQGHEQAHSYLRKKTYKKIARCLELQNPQDVEEYFWKYLKTKRK
jgi:hypothetical protein